MIEEEKKEKEKNNNGDNMSLNNAQWNQLLNEKVPGIIFLQQ